ncbi:MAG: GntR family transcriptional regulator [Pseudomonadota bacterium]
MQISEFLSREIAAGRLAHGARLPPERAMADELGVAVGTLRRALRDLTQRGLLERVQGSGNYVRDTGDDRSVYAFFRLERPEGGGLPTAQVLSARPSAPPEAGWAQGAGLEALQIRRVRALDGCAIALEEIWLHGDGARDLTAEDLSESLYLTYRRRLGITIERAEDRIGIGAVPEWGGACLALAPGASCGHVARRSWAAGRLVEISQTWFDAERARYVSRLR